MSEKTHYIHTVYGNINGLFLVVVQETGVKGVQAHTQKSWFVENRAKSKIRTKSRKIRLLEVTIFCVFCVTSKNESFDEFDEFAQNVFRTPKIWGQKSFVSQTNCDNIFDLIAITVCFQQVRSAQKLYEQKQLKHLQCELLQIWGVSGKMSPVYCMCDFDGAACKYLPMLYARLQLAKDVLCARQRKFSTLFPVLQLRCSL